MEEKLTNAERSPFKRPDEANTAFGEVRDLIARLRQASELSPGGEKWDPIADIGRLTAATGWRPEIPLEKTLADTLEYWRRRTRAD